MAKVGKQLRFEVLRRDNHACRYCGASAPDVKLTVDHVVPQALGGSDSPANLVTACEGCNSGKSATPPDAAVVDDVAADALRWARARRVAAGQLVAGLAARDRLRGQFLEAWNRWGLGQADNSPRVPLPGDWTNTVDKFIAAGLPIEVLVDCVERAMSADKVTPANTFRYMCGIGWRLVAQLDEATQAELDPDRGEEERQYPALSRDGLEERLMGWEQVAEDFLRAVPIWVHERAERAADHDFYCADEMAADRSERLPHVVRHVGRVLKECKVEPYPVAVD